MQHQVLCFRMTVNVRRGYRKGHRFQSSAGGKGHGMRAGIVEPIRECLPCPVHRDLTGRPAIYPDHHFAHLGIWRIDRVWDVHRGELHDRELVI